MRSERRRPPSVFLCWLVVTTVALGSCGTEDGRPDERGSRSSRDQHPDESQPSTSTTPSPSPSSTPTGHPQGEAPSGTGDGDNGDGDDRWRPAKGLSWQWQLSGEIDTNVEADVYDVDLFETPVSTVELLHSHGRRVICYFSAGSWEPYRPDAADYPESLLGGGIEGWPDERWIDIRQLDVLRPLLEARLDLCADKGFDGVEPDWLDGYLHDTGFELTADDQLRFNRLLAELAHERGLAIGLKNDPDQVAEQADLFDFAVVEQCIQFGECEAYAPFLDQDKPVFHAEYDVAPAEFCAESRRLGLSSIRKNLELDAWRQVC